MNPTDFFTRKIMGIDYRVWGAMLLVCFFSVGLYGYKQIGLSTTDDPTCPPDTIRVNGQTADFIATCYLDRAASFEVPSEGAATVEWDFKDGSKRENGRFVSHKFTEEGTYTVTATVDGRCKLKAEVKVVYDPFMSGDQAKPVIEIFADPVHPVVGSPVKLYCVTDLPLITSYEWKILNTNEVKRDAVPDFEFQREENYTIQVMINNDPSTLTTEVISVAAEIPKIPKTSDGGSGMGAPVDIGSLGRLVPPGADASNIHKDRQLNNGSGNLNPGSVKPDTIKKVSPPKVPEVDPAAFKDLLQNVVDQDGKELEDLYQYLDYRASTMVEVNENGSLMPLKDFCRNMRDKKKNKRKIESLSFKRDDQKSIQTIQVKIQKSGGFLDKLNPFN